MQQRTQNTIIIAIAIIVAALIIAFKLGAIGLPFTVTKETEFRGLDRTVLREVIVNPPVDEQCTLSISPSLVCAGDLITGRLTDGISTNCAVFVTDETDWVTIFGRTDVNGVWENVDRIDVPGNYRAIGFCDRDHSNSYTPADCFTNIVHLTVMDCAPPEDSPPPTTYTCGQGADQTTCGGTCPVGYSCYELWGDYYKWCACATGPQNGGDGYVHPDWKPDGQYFNPVTEGYSQQTCTYSDGGKDYFTKGQVTGYMEGGYFIDGSWDACTSSTRLSEYFCYQKDGVWYAMWETYNCENLGMTWGCYNGVCMEVL